MRESTDSDWLSSQWGKYTGIPEYAILKSFAVLEQTPGVPGLDLPGIDIVSLARGYGCDAARLNDIGAIKKAATEAWTKQTPTVLEIPISAQVPPLI
jgi:benzoylformate decarboxylase